ncbi:Ig-like domain-containing protein [Massilia yuzhufengensis]|uniref:Ig-like domain-containing protein n=1 Tax=Massilia yuzhufengensis TaxID=1164594 RepID=A0A1I1KKL3_9BURK|nr:Ig-like domain-containing protein [Massilia yuzhufengensis]SFC61201.1 Ig-like domain-containing protein [Massilia yuzhufengensis]
MTSTSTPVSSALPTTSARTEAGVTHVDLNFSTAMAKGAGSIFVTDGAVQTVIDRVTGQPKLRVVGATFTKEIALDQVQVSGSHVMFDAIGLPPGAELNIYMGAGALISGGKPLAAITVPGSAAFTTPDVVVEPPPPLLEASIAVQDKTLTAGTDITVTVSFSKALASLDRAAIVAEHASVKDIAHSVDGRTWTITLGAADSVDSPANVLRLDMSQVVSSDGTRGNGTLVSNPYSVDTDAPEVVGSPNEVTDFALDANIVVAFDQSIYWAAEAGDADMLYLHGDDGSTIEIYLGESNFSEGEGGTVLTIAPDQHHMQAGVTYTLVLPENLMDIAGNPVAGYEIAFTTAGDNGGGDTVAPSAVKVFVDGDGYYRAGDTITFRIRFDEDVQMASDAIVSIGLTGGRTATLDRVSGDELVFEYTVAADDNVASLAVTDLSQLVDNVEDFSNNPLASAHLAYEGLYGTTGYGSMIEVVLDTSAPAAPAAPALAAASDSGNSGDGITNDATPTLTGTAEGRAWVALYEGETLLGETRAASNGSWSITVDSGKSLADGARNLTVVQTDRAGNTSAGSAALALSIDTIAPAPAAPVLVAGSDSGSAGDGITNDNSPTLSGVVEANATVELFDGTTSLGTTIASGSGAWSMTLGSSTALADGVHTITVQQTDIAGNISVASDALELTIDTSAPNAALAPVLLTSDGTPSPDGITRNEARLGGSGAEANGQVKIMLGAATVGDGSADGNGNWTATFTSALADGLHSFTVHQVDAAGNLGAGSAISFTVDRTAPASTASTPLLDAASDTGSSSSDGITKDVTPLFSGTAAAASTTLVLYAGTREIGRTTTDGAGAWSIEVSEANKFTADGRYAITTRQIDTAGNVSEASAALEIEIDTTRPLLTAFTNNRTDKQFELTFSEAIVFHPDREFLLLRNGTERRVYAGDDDSNWNIVTNGSGKPVLILEIGNNGTFNLTMDSDDAIQDVAGNIAIVTGAPAWLVDLVI